MQHAAATSAKSALGQAVISFPNATGGGTTSVGTVQINDLEGKPLTRAVMVKLIQTVTQHVKTASGTATFASITGVGTAILDGDGTDTVIVRTTATGSFGITCTNSADETLWFSLENVDAKTALSEGIMVVEQVSDSATWSA